MLFDQSIIIDESLNDDMMTMVLTGERVRYSLRLKPADVMAAKKASGLKLPGKIGASAITANRTTLCLGPNEWLLIATPKAGEKLAAAMEKLSRQFVCSAVEISHRNLQFTVSGPGAARALNSACPLDLSLSAFPVGKCTRTIFEGAPIVLWRTGEDEFTVEVWRSFAPYLRDFLAKTAKDRHMAG